MGGAEAERWDIQWEREGGEDENKELAGSQQDHAVLFSISLAPHCLATTNQIVESELQPSQSAVGSVAP